MNLSLGIGLQLGLSSPAAAAAFNGLFMSVLNPAKVLQLVQTDIGVTQSGGLVSGLTDQAAAPHDFGATLTARPSVSAGVNSKPGVLFNSGGVTTNILSSTHALPQPGTTPYCIGLVFRQISWLSGGYVCGDANGVAGTLYSSDVTPKLRIYNGGAPGTPDGVPLGSWECTELRFGAAATDSLRRGSNAPVSSGSSAGNPAGAGTTLGNGSAGALPTNIELVHAVWYADVAMPAAWRAAVATFYGGSVLV